MEYQTHCKDFPWSVDIEITRSCDINPPCPMCSRNKKIYSGDLPLEVISRNKKLFEGASRIILGGVGEPLLSKNLPFLLQSFPNKAFEMYSNGRSLDQKKIDLLVSSLNLTRIVFGLDAATGQTYYKIRGNEVGDFDRTIFRIQELMNKINEKKRDIQVFLKLVVQKENLLEIVPFIELAKKIGVPGVIFGHLGISEYDPVIRRGRDFTWIYEEQCILGNKERIAQLNEIKPFAIQKAKDIGVSIHGTVIVQ